ncbi:MAG: hypothetical protein PSX36_03240 [bacterium]|nr:hypothetical protein [bacterium]
MKKVWTYIISKELQEPELRVLRDLGTAFVSGWTAHENRLEASFDIFEKRIIVIRVNEEVASASGCSIDKLQHFMKETEKKFGLELLNRLLVAYRGEGQVQVVHSSKIPQLLLENKISENTMVFDTAVYTGEELESWEQPLKSTWLKKHLVKV